MGCNIKGYLVTSHVSISEKTQYGQHQKVFEVAREAEVYFVWL